MYNLFINIYKGENMEKLNLVDVSIHERDWKQFRKTATQEELLILGLGVKYRIIKSRPVAWISLLGIVLSVVIGLLLMMTMDDMSAGLVVLVVGYVVFSFLATKIIRYSDSYGQIRRRLDKENKKLLKNAYNVSAAADFFDAFVQLPIMFTTIPYQALMMGIGMIAPNFAVSKNGVLVAIPKGYDIGNLQSMSAYYASYSLLEDMEKTSYENNHRYVVTFTNSMGCEETVCSPDGIKFYKENGEYVGYSNDNGKTIVDER